MKITRSAIVRNTIRLIAVPVLAVSIALAGWQFVLAGAVSNHAPIVIQSDSDFTSCSCVLSGAGTASSPYVIGPFAINNVNGNAVTIDGTNLTKSFRLLNLTIAGNSASTDTGIVLNHINPAGVAAIVASVYGTQTSITTNNVGILVENSSYVTLDGGGANPNGLGVLSSAGVINKNTNGAIDVENSSYITVKGWQINANGGDNSPDWVTLNPSIANWGVGGVRFFGVNYSTIDHNTANNDTDVSYALFNSNHNRLTGNTANYPFPMNYLFTDGSSYNTMDNNEGITGDFIGVLIADPLQGSWTLTTYGPSHDNAILNNVIRSDGPTGVEIQSGVSPAFLGGVVVLNGAFNNTIKYNQVTSNAGSDLAWAQAVPSSTGAINVVAYRPTLHCNVTQYNGSGIAPAYNGNLWVGNIYQRKDACLPAQ